MQVLLTLLRRSYLAVAELAWSALAVMALAHALVSWMLLALAGEGKLTGDAVDFLYYYLVSATTTGYGDLAPVTRAGRLVGVLFVLPGGIALFTAVLGKMLTGVGHLWRQRMMGLNDYGDRQGHFVVLGWHEDITPRLIEMLASERAGGTPPTVLVAKALERNPLPEMTDFIRVDRLADPEALRRSGASRARALVVRGQNDDETLAAALVASQGVETPHIVAYFEDVRTAAMLRRQEPRIEAIASLSSELIVRAAHDPGASLVASLLFSPARRDTVFSMRVPAHVAPMRYGQVLMGLKRDQRVTLVGLAAGDAVDLNCDEAALVEPGLVLYYIADHRLDPASVRWDRMATAGS
ncbi:potassium channel family protein [Aureimonas jatrophae]|uniref:potassium channel family protein n=1 Tax=Aureimonas jatrophae TaxID=1166073 RepID=UPI000B8A2C61|nr:potassium channel family protein [Aureimonas jatrophae]MBB3952589.1 voltage-gated potassium channel [Aureimonas jatrophae]